MGGLVGKCEGARCVSKYLAAKKRGEGASRGAGEEAVIIEEAAFQVWAGCEFRALCG